VRLSFEIIEGLHRKKGRVYAKQHGVKQDLMYPSVHLL
jgi:hypothetical protein